MPLPSQFYEDFAVTVDVAGGATVEAVTPVVGERLYVTSINIQATTAGAGGTTVLVRTKTGSAKIISADASAVGPRAEQWYGEKGYALPMGQGIEVVNGAAVVSVVVITGYRVKP